jgi:hypothetical protein
MYYCIYGQKGIVCERCGLFHNPSLVVSSYYSLATRENNKKGLQAKGFEPSRFYTLVPETSSITSRTHLLKWDLWFPHHFFILNRF